MSCRFSGFVSRKESHPCSECSQSSLCGRTVSRGCDYLRGHNRSFHTVRSNLKNGPTTTHGYHGNDHHHTWTLLGSLNPQESQLSTQTQFMRFWYGQQYSCCMQRVHVFCLKLHGVSIKWVTAEGRFVGNHRTHFKSDFWRSEVKRPFWKWLYQA